MSKTWELALNPDELARLFVQRANAGDADGLAELYEPDAILAGPGGQIIIGREAIRRFYADMLAGGRKFQAGEQRPALRRSGLALTSTKLSNGRVTAEVAREQPDSSWLWVVDQPAIAQEAS